MTSWWQYAHGEMGLQRRKARNDRMIGKTLRVRYEQPRLAERKALCYYTDSGLNLARGGKSSFYVYGGAHFTGQGSA